MRGIITCEGQKLIPELKIPEKLRPLAKLPLVNNQLQTIETLALVSDPAQAGQIATALRQAGIPTHQYWVEDSFSFAENLARCSWDLVIIAIDDEEQHVPACILRYPDTPFLAITQKNKSSMVDELLERGVTDVASFSRPARLKHALNRALSDASVRCEYRRLRQHKDDQDSLLRNLLRSSDEPVAFLHQGIHSFVNPAYLVTMGLPDPEAALSTPILDLVASQDQASLKKILQDFSESKVFEARLPTRIPRSGGGSVTVILDMSTARFDGENVVQCIARVQKQFASAVSSVTEQTAANEQSITYAATHKQEKPVELIDEKEAAEQFTPAHLDIDNADTLDTSNTITGDTDWTRDVSWASVSTAEMGHGDQGTIDEDWAKKMVAILGSTGLRIAIRAINSMKVDMFERYQLNLAVLPAPDNEDYEGPRSVEKLIAEARRHGLLPGLDRWVTYNAASQLAKQVRQRPGTRFFINLYGDQSTIEEMSGWLKHLIAKFRLPPRSLNVMLDGGGLTDNTRLSNELVLKLKNMNIGVGISGLNSEHLNGGLTPANAASDAEQTLRADLDEDVTVGFELLESLPVDFALLDSSFSDQIADQETRNSLRKLLQRCQAASITTMVEASGPGALSAVWKMGADCFIGDPGFGESDSVNADTSPAELDLTTAI